jgi:NhaA family Na+:H+ antiporter
VRADGGAVIEKMESHLFALRAAGVPVKERLLSPDQAKILTGMEHTVKASTPPLQGMEHALVPLVSFLVLPVFALANAGVKITSGFGQAYLDPICIGIILGLFIGKQIGIFGFSWLAVRLKLADLPSGVTWRHVHGVAALGGVGFTMSLFIGGIAFVNPDRMEVVKVGILSASLVSGLLGWFILRTAQRPYRGDR